MTKETALNLAPRTVNWRRSMPNGIEFAWNLNFIKISSAPSPSLDFGPSLADRAQLRLKFSGPYIRMASLSGGRRAVS